MSHAEGGYGGSPAAVNGVHESILEQQRQQSQGPSSYPPLGPPGSSGSGRNNNGAGFGQAAAGGAAAGPASSSSTMMNGMIQPSPYNIQQLQQMNAARLSQPPPVASTSAVTSVNQQSRPPPPPSNKIRKRQKVEYEPVKRIYNEQPGTWDPVQIEEVVTHASAKRQKRSARDLGFCDIHTLKMSLRSRIGPEVAFALNSLGLLSSTMEGQPSFAIGRHPELLEEILELFQEAVQGEEDEDSYLDNGESMHGAVKASTSGITMSPSKAGPSKGANVANSKRAESREAYHDAIQKSMGDEFKLRPVSSSSQADRFAGLDRNEVVLACLALFRNLSSTELSAKPSLTDPSLIQYTLMATKDPKSLRTLPEPPVHPLRFSHSQLLQARKEALQIIGNLGHNLHLEQHEPWVGQAIIDLLNYFLEISDSGTSPGPPSLGLLNSFTANVDSALYALARVMLTDANRDAFSKLPQQSSTLRPFIINKFATLLQLLPLTDLDFSTINSEHALVRIEMVAMCLFNLVYVASSEIRKKLRETPGTIKTLVRVVRKLYGFHLAQGPQDQQAATNLYLVLCQRCIEVLRVLSEDEASGGGQSSTGSQEGIAWFGSYSEGRETVGGSSGNGRSRPSLLFCKQDLVELLALPASDKFIFSSLADCT